MFLIYRLKYNKSFMNKFSKIEKGEQVLKKTVQEEIKYDGYHKIINYKNYEFVKENDVVVVLPYFVDEASIILRHEVVPTYQYFYKDLPDYKHVTNFLTVLSGTVEPGESLKNAVRRELYEEAGIVLASTYDFDIEKTVFMSKGNVGRYHVVIIELRYNDFKLTKPPGDGSQLEKISRSLKIGLGDIDSLKSHDLITEYMLTKFKLEYINKKK